MVARTEPATPQGGSSDGMAPENSGWTGGSRVGTNPSGASHAAKTWHRSTARGLELTGRAEAAPLC